MIGLKMKMKILSRLYLYIYIQFRVNKLHAKTLSLPRGFPCEKYLLALSLSNFDAETCELLFPLTIFPAPKNIKLAKMRGGRTLFFRSVIDKKAPSLLLHFSALDKTLFFILF